MIIHHINKALNTNVSKRKKKMKEKGRKSIEVNGTEEYDITQNNEYIGIN